MRPSDLDTYVVILEPDSTPDEFGQPVTEYVPFAEMFAKKTSRPGREFFQSSRVVNESRVYFTIRPHSGITTQQRVQHGSNEFEIVDVRESDKRGDSMQLECKAVS